MVRCIIGVTEATACKTDDGKQKTCKIPLFAVSNVLYIAVLTNLKRKMHIMVSLKNIVSIP